MKVKDIVDVCNAKLIFGDENIEVEDFCKDTRILNKGDIYVGIKGENFDGNTLFEDAFSKGAKVCLLDNAELDFSEELKNKYSDRAVVVADDSIKALQDLAKFKLSKYKIPVVAITGSVGKTSTKDIIASVVSMQYKTLKTQGNYNNHIGVPLTILSLKDHQAIVVEMGMNHSGELAVLSQIASPDVAVITNVGTAHIGNLGSRENILKAKLEITEGLKENGLLIVNNDNDMLNAWYKNKCINENKIVNTFTFGTDESSDIVAENVVLNENSSSFTVKTKLGIYEIYVPVAGMHFVLNALAAISVGIKLGISMEKIQEGIRTFELTKSRMEIINLKDNITIVNDCYNANYDSMKAAMDYLGKMAGKRKIAVLGDMLELGEYSNELHTKVGQEVIANNIDILVTVGEMGSVIANTVKNSDAKTEVYVCSCNEDAINILKSFVKENDFIVVKASNGMKFNEIIMEMQNVYAK